jgi:hypothetical protein
MNTRMRVALAVIGPVMLAACAATPVATPPPPTVNSGITETEKGGARHQEVTVTATVEKVDVKERRVTLRGPDGTTETIHVGPEVRNLPQLKRGDSVIATYYQSIAYEVVKPGEAKLGEEGVGGLATAAPGDKPGAVGGKVLTLVADIVKIDRNNQQVVLKGAKGKIVTVDVQRPEVFDKVKVGDRVEITYTEAVGIDVQAAPKTK